MKKQLFLLLFIVASLYSCEKNEADIASSLKVEQAVRVENGYLVFRDSRTLDSIADVLLQSSPEQVVKWEQSLPRFESYRAIFKTIQSRYESVNDDRGFEDFKQKYSNLVKIKPDSSIAYKFGTPLSSYFINKDGRFKVGAYFVSYTEDGRQIFDDGRKKREFNLGGPSSYKIMNIKHNDDNKIMMPGPGPSGTFLNGMVTSQLYYNSDGKRRLFVELWHEHLTPPGPGLPTAKFYFVTLQELKRTFGGWRANNTDYYQSYINWNWRLTDPPLATYVQNYSGGYLAYPGTTGPIVFGMGSYAGTAYGTFGSAKFYTGGVPSPPDFVISDY